MISQQQLFPVHHSPAQCVQESSPEETRGGTRGWGGARGWTHSHRASCWPGGPYSPLGVRWTAAGHDQMLVGVNLNLPFRFYVKRVAETVEDEEINSQHDPLHNTQQVGTDEGRRSSSFTLKHFQVQCRGDAINKGLDETLMFFCSSRIKLKESHI